MKHFLEKLDTQILEGLKIGGRFKLPAWGKSVSKILFCGMGGSAIGGDILRLLVAAGRKPLSFKVQRSGRLPAWVDASTLVIFSSYSGNTPEVLRNVAPALAAKAKILVLSSGGRLTQIALQKKIPCLQVPGGLPPRCAIGYLTFSLVPVFRKWRWLRFSAGEAREVVSTVRRVSRSRAKAMAKRLYGKFVHFYGCAAFAEPVLTRWRAQFAENAKTLASSHLMPEMLHNEIEGWKFPREIIRRSAALFFLDRQDPAWLQKKIQAVQKVIAKTGADVLEIRSEGKSLAARLFSLLVLADWTSYDLAVLNQVDPVRILTIDLLKKVR